MIFHRTRFAIRVPCYFITLVPGKITNANVAYDVVDLQQYCAVFFYN